MNTTFNYFKDKSNDREFGRQNDVITIRDG